MAEYISSDAARNALKESLPKGFKVTEREGTQVQGLMSEGFDGFLIRRDKNPKQITAETDLELKTITFYGPAQAYEEELIRKIEAVTGEHLTVIRHV